MRLSIASSQRSASSFEVCVAWFFIALFEALLRRLWPVTRHMAHCNNFNTVFLYSVDHYIGRWQYQFSRTSPSADASKIGHSRQPSHCGSNLLKQVLSSSWIIYLNSVINGA